MIVDQHIEVVVEEQRIVSLLEVLLPRTFSSKVVHVVPSTNDQPPFLIYKRQ